MLLVTLRLEMICMNEEMQGLGSSVEEESPLPAPVCCNTSADHSQSSLGKGETE